MPRGTEVHVGFFCPQSKQICVAGEVSMGGGNVQKLDFTRMKISFLEQARAHCMRRDEPCLLALSSVSRRSSATAASTQARSFWRRKTVGAGRRDICVCCGNPGIGTGCLVSVLPGGDGAVVEPVGGRRDAVRWIKGSKGTARRINCSEAQYYRLSGRGRSRSAPATTLLLWSLAFSGLAHKAPQPCFPRLVQHSSSRYWAVVDI